VKLLSRSVDKSHHCHMSNDEIPKGSKQYEAGHRLYSLLRGVTLPPSILMYHQISSGTRAKKFNPHLGLQVDVDSFRDQMRLLSRTHQCLSLSRFSDLLKERRLPPNSVTVTFDDGYRDGLTLALPILERFQIPATIFVTTGFLDHRAPVWWRELEAIIQNSNQLDFSWENQSYRYSLQAISQRDDCFAALTTLFERLSPQKICRLLKIIQQSVSRRDQADVEMLSWSDVEALSSHPLITIGAHTVNHPALSFQTDELAMRELAQSREELSDKTKSAIQHFAYPFGSTAHVSPREIKLAREIGFSTACITYFGHASHAFFSYPHALPRINIDWDDTLFSFARKLTGIDALIYSKVKKRKYPHFLSDRCPQIDVVPSELARSRCNFSSGNV